MNTLASKMIIVGLLIGYACSLQAHVALDYPQGGETFIAGDTITVEWHKVIPHNVLNWDLFFSYDGGTTWDTIQIDIPPDDSTYQWEVPTISTTQGRVLVIMDNEGTDYQHSSMEFSITLTPPPPAIAVAAQDTTIECSDTNQAAAIQTWLDNHGGATATGFCGNLIWTNDFTTLSDSCGASGSALVTFTATDDCGNNTTSATLTIVDTTAPNIDLPTVDLTVECDGNGNSAELNNWLDSQGGAFAVDFCSNVNWTNDFLGLPDTCLALDSLRVTFTATDKCGNSSTTDAVITLLGTTGTSAPSQLDFNLEVFPNPSTGTIWLKSQPSDLTIRSVEVFDLSGRLINEAIWQSNAEVRELRLGQPVEGYKFLKIQTDAGTVTRKIEILKN